MYNKILTDGIGITDGGCVRLEGLSQPFLSTYQKQVLSTICMIVFPILSIFVYLLLNDRTESIKLNQIGD